MISQAARRPFRLLPALTAAIASLGAVAAAAPSASAGQPTAAVDKNVTRSLGAEEPVPLNLFETGGSYVGESSFTTKQFDGAGPLQSQREYGDQDEFHEYISYARRIQLVGRTYLKLGASYDRFDFGTTFAPLPTTLQSINATVGVEYIVQGRPGIFFETKPGVYFSDFNDITLGSFDAPTALAGVVPIAKNFYVIVGVRGSILAKYPVLPIVGAVWVITDKLRLEAVPPEPRLIYSFSEKLDVFVGGEILGETYRRDRNDNARPQDQRFNNGVIDYSEYRLNAGFTFTPVKGFDIDVSGGYVPQREFDYYRGDSKRFTTHGAPYAKIALKAEF